MGTVTREYIQKLISDVKGTDFARNSFVCRIRDMIEGNRDEDFDLTDEDESIINMIITELGFVEEDKKKTGESIFKRFK